MRVWQSRMTPRILLLCDGLTMLSLNLWWNLDLNGPSRSLLSPGSTHNLAPFNAPPITSMAVRPVSMVVIHRGSSQVDMITRSMLWADVTDGTGTSHCDGSGCQLWFSPAWQCLLTNAGNWLVNRRVQLLTYCEILNNGRDVRLKTASKLL